MQTATVLSSCIYMHISLSTCDKISFSFSLCLSLQLSKNKWDYARDLEFPLRSEDAEVTLIKQCISNSPCSARNIDRHADHAIGRVKSHKRILHLFTWQIDLLHRIDKEAFVLSSTNLVRPWMSVDVIWQLLKYRRGRKRKGKTIDKKSVEWTIRREEERECAIDKLNIRFTGKPWAFGPARS